MLNPDTVAYKLKMYQQIEEQEKVGKKSPKKSKLNNKQIKGIKLSLGTIKNG
jgi:hypothetical protein